MANKSIKELIHLSKDELATKIRESEAELFKTRMTHKTGQLKETAKLWKIRKQIARMKMLHSRSGAQAGGK